MRPVSITLVLHNIRSLHNVGSIFRTADGAGVERIYLCGITPSPVDAFGRYRPQVSKVALGAQRSVPWEKAVSTARVIEKLRSDGVKVFAVEQSENSIPYFRLPKSVTPHSKICLVLGSEVLGLPKSIMARCDKILEIPMRGRLIRHARHPRRLKQGKESLNVSVAAGIVLFSLIQNAK